MKLFKLTLCMLAVTALGACKHHPGHPHDGDFCPPGQAKKGNC